MGYAVRVLAIDFTKLTAVPGSRDSELLAALRPELEEAWDPDDDDDFEGDEDDEALGEASGSWVSSRERGVAKRGHEPDERRAVR